MGQARGIFAGEAEGISEPVFPNRNLNPNLNRFDKYRL
jgi:hypothetical protein